MVANPTVKSVPIVILPLGVVSTDVLMLVQHFLRENLSLRSAILPALVIPPQIFNQSRGQWDADQLLELLFVNLPDYAGRIIGVMEEDMFAAGRTFVFGYAHLRDGVSVISTARLREGWYRRPNNDYLLASRIRRAVNHEVGHTFGNPHCEGTCVMHSVSQLENLDALPALFCYLCSKRVERGRRISPSSAEGRFQRAGALSRRRQHPEAIQAYRQAVERAPLEARYHNDLGVALLAVSDYKEAMQTFLRATELSADFPHPYYNLGIMCRKDGGAETAERWFKEGIRRDPDKLIAYRYVGKLYRDWFLDEALAFKYFRTYLELGGDDQEIVAWVLLRDKAAPVPKD